MRAALISPKSALFLVFTLLATSAAMGDSVPAIDAHAQAAALLSRPYSIGPASAGPVLSASVKSSETDGHARAAALLSRPRTSVAAAAVFATHSSSAVRSADGQTQAAALLSGSRTT
jgi:hypothetical protein